MPKFSDAPNTAVLTTTQVMQRELPILLVSHDADDGAWQFLCNVREPKEADLMIVALHRIIELDPTVQEVSDLPLGHVATRSEVGATWHAEPAE